MIEKDTSIAHTEKSVPEEGAVLTCPGNSEADSEGASVDTAEKEAAGASEGRSLEQLFSELDRVYAALSEEESLEKSFKLYQEGVGLLKAANDSIDRIEKQVKVLDEDGILA